MAEKLLTVPQIIALLYLRKHTGKKSGNINPIVYPAELGDAICRGQSKRELKPQGAGRLGGSMGYRLVKAGLALHSRGCGYVISEKGAEALARAEAGNG